MAGNNETSRQFRDEQYAATTGHHLINTDDENADTPPPPYSTSTELQFSDFREPPAYTDVVKLPTYSEVEDIHRENAIRDMFGLGHSESEIPSYQDLHESDDDPSIGTDFGFMVCFLISFLLNWIGFLAGYCFSSSLACRYGALSGFGLSLVKWGFLIKHSECCSEFFGDRIWTMWLFVIAGCLIFFRGLLAYFQLKRAARR